MIRAIDRLEPFQRAISKAHLAAAGVSLDALDTKPLIAIANSWNEICPGHEPLRQLAEDVKKGIIEAGGEPVEFNTIAMCDGIAQGHSGMRYCLPHREIVTDSIEAMVVGEGVFDGVVYLACSTFTVTEDDFIQTDCIVALNPETAVQTALNSDSIDMLFYSESDPAVKVSGGRIYFSAYDMERWALCLKSMNLDGSDLKLLAYGLSYAEG